MTLREASIQEALVPGGSRYALPPREGRAVRVAGLGLAGFGLAMTVFMVFWMSGPLRGAFSAPSGLNVFLLVFGLLGLLGLVPALGMLTLGIGLATGRSRCEVEAAAGRLRLIERVGPFRWSWIRQADQVRRLELQDGMPVTVTSGTNRPVVVPMDYGCIAVHTDAARRPPLLVGLGYRPPQLRPLADRLAADLNTGVVRASAADPVPGGVTVVEAGPAGCEDADRVVLENPPATTIVVQPLRDGVAVSVPPAGLLKGSHGLFAFAIVWDAFVSVFVAVMVLGSRTPGEAPPPMAWLVIAALFLIGTGLMLGAIGMGQRRALLALTGGVLTVRQISPFRVREWSLPVAEVVGVRVGPSGIKVNNRPVMELQILPREGATFGFLSQRSEAELQWLAAVLRRHIGGAAGSGGH